MLLGKRMRALIVSGVLLGPAFYSAFCFWSSFPPFDIPITIQRTQLSKLLKPLRNTIYCTLTICVYSSDDGESLIDVMRGSADLSASHRSGENVPGFDGY